MTIKFHGDESVEHMQFSLGNNYPPCLNRVEFADIRSYIQLPCFSYISDKNLLLILQTLNLFYSSFMP